MSRFVLIYNLVFHIGWLELFFLFSDWSMHSQSWRKSSQSSKTLRKVTRKTRMFMMQLKRVKLNLRQVKCLMTSCFVDSYHPLWLYFWRYQCNMIEKQLGLLYSWKCFPNSACSHWLLWVHMTSINETVSRQNLWAGTLQNLWRRRVTVHCYPRKLTDDRRYSEV